MCPACLSTFALIATGAGSAGGLAAVVVKTIRRKAVAPPDANMTRNLTRPGTRAGA